MKYYGAVCCTLDKTVSKIEGDHEYKPSIESAGWFGHCKWFDNEDDRNAFIGYAIAELGYRINP